MTSILVQAMELSGIADLIRDEDSDSLIQTAASVNFSQDDLAKLVDALATVDNVAMKGFDDGVDIMDNDMQQKPIKTSKSTNVSARNGKASYVQLIATLILSSPGKRLLVPELYDGIAKDWPQFLLNKKAVRHTLSANCFFVQNGLGPNSRVNYWSVHSACVAMFRKGDFRRREAKRLVQRQERERQDKTMNSCQNNSENFSGISEDYKDSGIQPQDAYVAHNTIFSPQQLHQLQCQIQFYQQLQHQVQKPQQLHYNQCQQEFTYQEHQISQQPHQHDLFVNNPNIELQQSFM